MGGPGAVELLLFMNHNIMLLCRQRYDRKRRILISDCKFPRLQSPAVTVAIFPLPCGLSLDVRFGGVISLVIRLITLMQFVSSFTDGSYIVLGRTPIYVSELMEVIMCSNHEPLGSHTSCKSPLNVSGTYVGVNRFVDSFSNMEYIQGKTTASAMKRFTRCRKTFANYARPLPFPSVS